MSYSIIRNAKYKMSNLPSLSRHDERQNKEYGNKEIDLEKTHLNYHLKKPIEKSYEKEFERIKKENKLKGNLRLTGKKQSNVICEFLITSDTEFFNKIGENETKRFFEESFKFACQKCGEKNIISSVVHLDETTPHMHLSYIPVVKDKTKKGELVEKINCSKFWQGFNSYGELQNEFYAYITEKGFDLQRGEVSDRNHIETKKFKKIILDKKIEETEKELNIIKDDLQSIQSVKLDVFGLNLIDDKKEVKGWLKKKIELPESDYYILFNKSREGVVNETNLKILKNQLENIQKQKDNLIEKCRCLQKENKKLNEIIGFWECFKNKMKENHKDILNNLIKEVEKNKIKTQIENKNKKNEQIQM